MIDAFDVGFGQELCESVTNSLGYGCSLMGDGGVIVASNNRERIGVCHAGAARIMRGEASEARVTSEEAAGSGGKMKEGVSIPIDLDGARVACVGIAGPLDEVAPLSLVLSLFIRAMIKRDKADRLRSREVSAQVANATRVASAASDASRDTDRAVAALHESTARIDQVLRQIERISTQTKMLALNANIEASRAGSAGEGFGVVAREVKQLAFQSAAATREISEQIAHIQKATENVGASMGTIIATIDDVGAIIATVSQTMAVASGAL